MKERLNGSDYRFIAVCLALLAATAWFSLGNFYRAFPEASIDFRVNREEGQELAGRFLAQQGYRTETYRQASSFSFDDDAKTFLEREAGLEQANQLMGTKVRLWRWSYRWFRPQQKEEFRAEITTRGELAGFGHELPEDAARPEVTAVRARSLAEDFLRTRLKRDLASLEFVEASDVARPHRTDRVFTWRERDFNLHDATNRVEVTLLGDEVGAYREYLKTPEQWGRDYQRLRSKNEMAQVVDTAFIVPLVVAMVVVIVMRVRRHDIRWRRAGVVGIVGMVLSFCSSLNQFPLQEFQYPTTDSYSSFLSRELIQAVISALASGGLLFVLTAAAEPLYREMFRDKVSVGNLFSLRALRTKRFFKGAILGITLTGIFIAYQTGFYIVAYKFGAWSPADVPYSDLLKTRFPWMFVLMGGFLPAVSEEFLFRMFAIPFLRKVTRSLAIAVILAGFIWGFGHSGYPQQPFYIRGMEVGIGGVALGLIMLRWCILPTLVWHYSVDAMYSAMLLLRSQSLYFRLSGAASAGVIVLPVLVALVAYWRGGGFEPETGLLNGDEGSAPELEGELEKTDEPADLPYRAAGTGMRVAAVAVLAIGLVTLIVPVSQFGKSPEYRIPREQAFAISEAFLRAQGVDTGGYRHTTFPGAHWEGDAHDNLAGKYFLERRPVEEASRLFEENRPVEFWGTRFYRSLDQEEFAVSVHPETGKVLGFLHTLPEDRAGADLSDDAARQLAAEFAMRNGRDVSAMDLKENISEKKKARRDHRLEWEARTGDPRNVDETRFRIMAQVSGDQVTLLGTHWKLPEEYLRARSRQNLISIAVLVLGVGVLAAMVVWGLLLLVQNIRAGLVPWKTTIWTAGIAAMVAAGGRLLGMELTLQNYSTAIPLATYQATVSIVILMSAVFAFLFLGAAVALLTSFYPEVLTAWRPGNRRLLARDAGAALMAAVGIGLIVRLVEVWLLSRFHRQALLSFDSPDLLVSALPAAEALAGAVRWTIFYAAMLGTMVLIGRRLPGWAKIPAGLLAVCGLLSTEIRTPAEFGLEYGMALVAGAGALLFCKWFARGNYLAYLLAFWVLALRGPIAQLLGTGIPAMRVQGWVVVGVLAAGVVWALLPGIAGKPAAKTQAA